MMFRRTSLVSSALALLLSRCGLVAQKHGAQRILSNHVDEHVCLSGYSIEETTVTGQQKSVEDVQPTFESPEHASLGDAVLIRYPKENISGSDFHYDINGQKLSFGDIVALAGDYYGTTYKTYCPPTPGETWDKSPKKAAELFMENAKTLKDDSSTSPSCILGYVKEQGQEVWDGFNQGRDPAQVYDATETYYDYYFEYCDWWYGALSICNFDHFGNNTANAYRAGHGVALLQAKKAKETQDAKDLKEAYYLEAFSQHFMTDSFSTGHMRVPRHQVHSTSRGWDWKSFPGDQCAQRHHDEDSAFGLWVTNALGQSWAAYGDKQLIQGRSAKNRQYAVEACQLGVDEIWNTYQSGDIPSPSAFKALEKIPIMEKTNGMGNFVSLFQWNPDNPEVILMREFLDLRARDKTVEIREPDNDRWSELLAKIDRSGSSTNKLAYTRPFSSASSFIHLRQLVDSTDNITANTYGDVDAGKFGCSWSMNSQLIAPFSGEKYLIWTSATNLGNGVISLVGRLSKDNQGTTASHVGLFVSPGSDGGGKAQLLWSSDEKDGNSQFLPGEVIYGNFSEDGKSTAMVKYFDGKKFSKIELWSVPSKEGDAPRKYDSELNVTNLNFLFHHKVQSNDAFSTLVGYGVDPSSFHGTWYFSTWNSEYTKESLTTIAEQAAQPAQAVLSGSSSKTGVAAQIVRIYYGERYRVSQELRIDVLETTRNDSTGAVSFKEPIDKRSYPITWGALLERDYLYWFLSDVDNDGVDDLVAYTSDRSNVKLAVVVFPGYPTGGFAPPVVSKIVPDPEKGTLQTAEYMTPLYTSQGDYTYPGGYGSTESAIISFFDNYQVIGARILAPQLAKGSLRYEYMGQNPGIAGQISTGLGIRPDDWMGLKKQPETVGIMGWN